MFAPALAEAVTGASIGAAFGAAMWAAWATRIERSNQGLFGSAGLAALIGVCLWLDGWVLTAIPAYAVAVAAGGALRARLRPLPDGDDR